MTQGAGPMAKGVPGVVVTAAEFAADAQSTGLARAIARTGRQQTRRLGAPARELRAGTPQTPSARR